MRALEKATMILFHTRFVSLVGGIKDGKEKKDQEMVIGSSALVWG